MYVYRYEDARGLGPFQHQGLNRIMAHLPNPRDIGLSHRRGWRYGARTLQDLFSYFGSHIRDIEQRGYRLVRYLVPDNQAITAENQVMFNPEAVQAFEELD